MSDRRDRGAGFLGGLICGALAGAGLFYFLTNTEEGKKAKEKIKKQGKQALDSLKEIVGELEDKGEEFRQKAQKLQGDLEEKVKNVKEEVSRETKENLSRRVAKLFTRGGQPLKPAKTKPA